MKKKELLFYKKLLLERQKEIIKGIDFQEDNIRQLQHERPSDQADTATDSASVSSSLELLMALGDSDRIELNDIDLALEKIEDKTYGTCEVCGSNIGKDRLEAIPTASLCHPCKEKEEKEKVLYTPRRGTAWSHQTVEGEKESNLNDSNKTDEE